MSGLEIVSHWLHTAQDLYDRVLSGGHPRTSEWPLMHSPLPTLCVCILYAIFVTLLGPWLMRNRKPMELRGLMIAYNFTMVIYSLVIFVGLGFYGWFGTYNWYCQPVDYSDSRDSIVNAHLAWWYYISKFIEFADTLFFVARKKFSQISTLHVIHHGIMPMSVWWGVKFTPGGHSLFFAFINSLVHVIMYTYYAMAAIGPQMQKYLWWKQHVTSFQMLQFIAIFLHSFQLLFRPDCDYPRGFMWWIGAHAVLFWCLFFVFYRKTYFGRRVPSNVDKDANNNGEDLQIIKNCIGENGIPNGHSQLNGLRSDRKNGLDGNRLRRVVPLQTTSQREDSFR